MEQFVQFSNQAQGRPSTGTGYSGLGTALEPPESPSRIRDGVGQTEQTLSAIHEAISSLEKRLDTVLRPVPPMAQSNQVSPATPQSIASHLTGRVNILNEGFLHAVQRLHELAGRVEV